MAPHRLPFLRGRGLPWLLFGLIFIAGMLLRLGAVSGSVVSDPIRGDARSYFFYAVNLIEDGVYSRAMPPAFGGEAPVQADADASPGYPLMVRALLTDSWRTVTAEGVFGSITHLIDAQVLLSGVALLAVFLIGRRLGGNAVALAATALTALSPHLVNINIYMLTEPLFIVLFWMAMALLARLACRPDARALALAGGFVLALATLVRPAVQYLPLLLAGLLLLAPGRDRRQAWLLLAGFALPMLAWTLRNLVSVGSASSSLGMIATIQVGAYPDFMYNGIAASQGVPYHFDPELTDYSSMERTLSVLAERFRAEPGKYLYWYLIGKPLAFFHWETIAIGAGTPRDLVVAGDIYLYPTIVTPYASHPAYIGSYILSKLLHAPLLAVAAVGCVLAWLPSWRHAWGEGLPVARLLAATLVYAVGIHMIGAPFPRYSIPFLPLAYLLAAATLAALWRYSRARAGAGSASPGAPSPLAPPPPAGD